MSLLIIASSGCITGEQQLCPDSAPGCGNDNMPPAALGSICVSDCTDFNGALYCLIDGGGWGWCADQTGSCGNGHHFQFTHLHEQKEKFYIHTHIYILNLNNLFLFCNI